MFCQYRLSMGHFIHIKVCRIFLVDTAREINFIKFA